MAVDICTEIPSLVVSPRISFSHDLKQTDGIPVECHHSRRSDAFLLDSDIDFDFCIGKSFIQLELPPADELFADGKILPIKAKKEEIVQQSESIPIQPTLGSTASTTKIKAENPNEDSKKKRLKEFLSNSLDAEEEKPQSQSQSKPFWQFRRSSSLNCETGRSKGLIRSLHFLSRSNSTGSAPNPKQQAIPKIIQKQNSKKLQSVTSANSSSSSSYSNQHYPYSSSRRPPAKNNFGSYGNGVKISPVLNIPPTYISKGTASLFGFGSLFCTGKNKKKKK